MQRKEYLQFTGVGDVKKFITKVELQAELKGHVEEKKAQFLASKLDGPALDIYLRLSTDDRKNPDIITENLLREFKREQRNREEALEMLGTRSKSNEESPETFAYKVLELVQLAYASMAVNVQETIAKDYYVKGLSKEIQVALKSLPDFSTRSLTDLSTETSRLEIAGVGSSASVNVHAIEAVHQGDISDRNPDIVEDIVTKVVDRLKAADISSSSEISEVQYVGQEGGSRSTSNRSNRYRRGRRSARQPRESQQRQSSLKCRSCQNTGHLFRNCPVRFCQACGNRGHDAWNNSCPNYQ